MTTEIILAGFGGQGILFAGKILAYCGLLSGKEISWLPSYGPEMRGGTANCCVCVSDAPIGSPVVTAPDCFIAMNEPSYRKFIGSVKPGGIVISDSNAVGKVGGRNDVKEISVPASDIAEREHLHGAANMVLIGEMLRETGLFSVDVVEKAMEKCVSKKRANLVASNMKAVELGMKTDVRDDICA